MDDSDADPVRVQARATPDGTAIVDADSDWSWTYRALDRRLDEIVSWLRSAGLESGDRLGVIGPGGSAFAELCHAATRAGLVFAPTSHESTARERSRWATLVDPAAIVAIEGHRSTVDGYEILEFPPTGDVAIAGRSPDLGPADPMAILQTSGTSGRPKAVVLTRRNIHRGAIAAAFRLGVLPADRWLCCLPPHHMGGLAPLYRAAIYGTTVVVTRERFEPIWIERLVADRAITGVSLVPTMLERLVDAEWTPPETLRTVLLGGGPIPPELVTRSLDHGIPVSPTYGLTETASQVATARPSQVRDAPSTVGHPLPWTTVTIVGSDGEPVQPGTVGEIVVAGPAVMAGYLDDPAATEAAMGRHGFHTGDRGRIDTSGRLTVVGRANDRIVSGGVTIDPVEVSRVLENHPTVAEATVVGIGDPEWGERVAALVVIEEGEKVDAHRSTLESWCRTHLSPPKRPKRIVFVDSVPRTASGTVDRPAVRRRIESADDA